MRALIVLLASVAPSSAAAHADGAATDGTGWSFALWLTTPLALSALLWVVGCIRRARRTHRGQSVLRREGAWFAVAWAVLALTALSPLHAAGERSFTMHMIEHEILMLIAAPAFVLARPLPTMLWGLAQPWRGWLGAAVAYTSPLWRTIAAPVFATIAQASALWLWHAPSLFDLALSSDVWHAAQHLSFFITALIFWAGMLDNRSAIGLRALCLFATSIVIGALGALMAFSESPWYAPYSLLGMTPQGLTPAEDQQFAGLLMWIPGGVVHAGAALALLAPFLRAGETASRAP